MSWRDAQVEATRRRIIDTFLELSAGADTAPVTVAEVGRSSGVSPATIYRHFPSRAELVSAAANDRTAMSDSGGEPEAWTFESMWTHLRSLWSELAQNMAVTREGAVSEAGRELRQARFDGVKADLDASLAAHGLDVTDSRVVHFEAMLMLLASVHTFIDLHDRQGKSPAQAVETVAWAMSVLARELGLEPDVIVFGPVPPERGETT